MASTGMFGWFQNLRVAAKVAVAVGVALALMVVLGVLMVGNLSKVNAGVKRIYNDRVVPMKGLKVISDMYAVNYVDVCHKVRDGLMTFDQGLRSLDEAGEAIRREWDAYLATTLTPEEAKMVEEFKPLKAAGDRLVERIRQAMESRDPKAVGAIAATDLYPTIDPITAKISDLIVLQMDVAEQESEAANRIFRQSRDATVLVVGLSLVLTLGIGWFVTRGITVPLRHVGDALLAFEEGRLDVEIPAGGRDEVGQMAERFRYLHGKLSETIGWASRIASGDLALREGDRKLRETDLLGQALRSTVMSLRTLVETATQIGVDLKEKSRMLAEEAAHTNDAAEAVSRSVDEVSHAAGESARATSEIAAGSEQLARTATQASEVMNRLLAVIEQIQAGSQQQVEAAKEATKVGLNGNEAVEATIQSMAGIKTEVEASAEVVRELGEKQEQIGAIVAAIEDIAAQTNLLALNAAIEAARAGAQGRGFAVVADEVRKLAERAASSTTEIAQLIDVVRKGVDEAIRAMERSTEQVRIGTEQSAQAKTALAGILQSIDTLTAIADKNYEMTQKVTAEANRVEDSINSVAGISQETAAAAEEMSANSQQVAASAAYVAEAVQRQTRSVAEVSRIATDLDLTTQSLSDTLARFRLAHASEQETPILRVA